MSRRVSKSLVAIFTLSVILSSTPSAFAAGRGPSFGDDSSAGPVERIVRIMKKLVKPLLPQTHDENIVYPGPPKP